MDFDFEIIYRKGSENSKVDAFSRREDLKPEKETYSASLLRTNRNSNLELDAYKINTT